jgi:peptidoglycan/xylan/chitin deacetylase (PgdA/CDA1 family)
MQAARGKFVISLDMELMWGVRDHRSKADYGHRVLGEREAVPAMLDRFEANDIHATWAVVGFVMCDGRDELMARAPSERPSYDNSVYSSYSYLDEAGLSEKDDPFYFAPSLVRAIAACPRQEISTHTFSHYYCLEPGQTPQQFGADLDAAIKQLGDWGLDCASIVFPRNQYSPLYLDIVASRGIKVFRGSEQSWFYHSDPKAQNLARRLGRMADSYLSVTGSNTQNPRRLGDMTDVPSSRILRPYNHKLRSLEGLRLSRITRAMTRAAKDGTIFHLWWHPHNFGADTEENVAFLARILAHYRTLADRYGMESATMKEAAA